MKLRTITSVALIAAALYYGAAAYVIRYEIDRLLFPAVPGTTRGLVDRAFQSPSPSTGSLLLRSYGNNRAGCVIFFPGQHGGLAAHENTLFPPLLAEGIRVFSVSYPGQDGAPGRSSLADVNVLAAQAVASVIQRCGADKTVVLGRSLGAMVAAYSIVDQRVAGLILESTAPSLSTALTTRLHSRWYLKPLLVMPVKQLLRHDYALAEALGAQASSPVVIFQGTLDQQTPSERLRFSVSVSSRVRVIAVVGGTHSNTYVIANRAIVSTIRTLLQRNTQPLARRQILACRHPTRAQTKTSTCGRTHSGAAGGRVLLVKRAMDGRSGAQ